MRYGAGIVVALVLGCAGLPALAAEVRTCIIASIDGASAQFVRNGTIQALLVGATARNSDRIITGPATRVHIECDDGARVTLGAETDIDLGMLSGPAADEGYAARLFRGISGFIFPPGAEGNFEVRTPNAVASVRSTEWTVDVDGGNTSVFVRRGLVVVSGKRGGGALGPGDGIDIGQGISGTRSLNLDALPVVEVWGEARIGAMNARLGFDWQ